MPTSRNAQGWPEGVVSAAVHAVAAQSRTLQSALVEIEPLVAYIGVGSNLGDSESQVRGALAELDRLPASRLLAVSKLYCTAPVGPSDQPDYVNAAAGLETRLRPRVLLSSLQRIELTHGRRRDGARWGPRALDLDILLYGDQNIDLPGLRIPHPELPNRAFVLVPLADVTPIGFWVSGLGPLVRLIERCPLDGVRPLGESSETSSAARGKLAEFPGLHTNRCP